MPTPSVPHVRLRVAAESDIPFLLSLRRLVMGPHRTLAGIPETAEQARAKVLKDFESAYIVLHGNKPIGLFKANREASPWSVSQIQLVPEWQGRGIGSKLVSQFVASARTQGEAVELSVLKVNPALRMYQRLGFSIVSEGVHGVTLRTEANSSVNATANGTAPDPRSTVAHHVPRRPGTLPSSARYLKR